MSIKVLLVLLTSLIGVANSCSCARVKYTSVICDDRYKYIMEVKVTRILEKEKEEGDESVTQDPFATSTYMTTSSPYWSQTRTVEAVITRFYKGDESGKHKVGSNTTLASGMMDSMCGMGEYLLPGSRFVLATSDLSYNEMGLCANNFVVDGRNWANIEPILKNHDCDCKISECKLREGRRVLRGKCHDTNAYCSRDKKGSCRWKNARSIDSCRHGLYGYGFA